jgi:hypothetical protein
VHLLHYWLSALEEPNTLIRTCLIDFSKAFDRIDHNIDHNDLASQLPLYKYVDDSALSEVVKVGKSDPLTLQQEVDRVNQWSIANNMKLNVKKTK